MLAEEDDHEMPEDQQLTIQSEDVITHLVAKQTYHLSMVIKAQANIHPEVCCIR